MKHLVTGGNGFIGRALVAHLMEKFSTQENQEVVSLGSANYPQSPCPHFVCDLTNKNAVKFALNQIQPDWVYHLAGSPRITDGTRFPDYFAKNFISTAFLSEALTALGKKIRLFYASSVHVYGNQPGSVHEEAPCHPMTTYGFTKYLAEEFLRAQAQANAQFSVMVGRLYSCMGPGQGPGFVAADLCRKIALLKGQTDDVLTVGPLSGSRTFLDVRDAVTLFPKLLAAMPASCFEIVNISSPHTLQISHVLKLLLEIAKKAPQIQSNTQTGENKFAGLMASNEKLKQLVPQFSFRPIENTLHDMYQWTETNIEKLKSIKSKAQ